MKLEERSLIFNNLGFQQHGLCARDNRLIIHHIRLYPLEPVVHYIAVPLATCLEKPHTPFSRAILLSQHHSICAVSSASKQILEEVGSFVFFVWFANHQNKFLEGLVVLSPLTSKWLSTRYGEEASKFLIYKFDSIYEFHWSESLHLVSEMSWGCP